MSYAEASIRGAAEPDGENTVPIESVNVTPEEVKTALENKPESSESETELEKVKGKAKDKAKKAKKSFKKSIDELENDPRASATALAGILAVVATTVGLVQTKRNNATITAQQGAIVGAGIALVSTAYYLFLTRNDLPLSKK